MLLDDIRRARVGVVGDFCVDSYYIVDSGASRPSLETGLMTRPVREQRSTLGGAGNVAANLQAIGVQHISAFAVVGPDSIGTELLRLLHAIGVNTAGVAVQAAGWQTNCYLKPIVEGQESNRFDFGILNAMARESEHALLGSLERALPALDVLIINQQFERGLHSAAVREGINRLLARNPRVLALVDCRNLAEAYPVGILKLNDLEASRLCGEARSPAEVITRGEALGFAARLFSRWSKALVVTRGGQGCIVVDDSGTHEIPGLRVTGEIDTVGAGDSVVSGIAATMAVGCAPAEAAAFGSLVAGVTVRKLHQTGTASPDEIRELHRHATYLEIR